MMNMLAISPVRNSNIRFSSSSNSTKEITRQNTAVHNDSYNLSSDNPNKKKYKAIIISLIAGGVITLGTYFLFRKGQSPENLVKQKEFEQVRKKILELKEKISHASAEEQAILKEEISKLRDSLIKGDKSNMDSATFKTLEGILDFLSLL